MKYTKIFGVMLFLFISIFSFSKEVSTVKLKDINGKEYTFPQGKKVYIKAWASWCPICLASLEEFNNIDKSKEDFEIVSVVFPGKNGEKKEKDFIEWYKGLGYNNITVLIDEKGELIKKARIRAYPTSVLINEKGEIEKSQPGVLSLEDMRRFVGSKKIENKSEDSSKDVAKTSQGAKEDIREIYLAGGCFWGIEAYMERINGVIDAVSGYANGNTENPSYQDVVYRNTGHAETVKVTYDANKLPLGTLLEYYFKVIDPTSLNKQGNDRGTQYRTGIYYTDPKDEKVITDKLASLQKRYSKKVVVENKKLKNFYKAEEYHQDYLKKNPNGYCHIDITKADEVLIDPEQYKKLSQEELRNTLTDEEYRVTQLNATERAFTNRYWNFFEKGI